MHELNYTMVGIVNSTTRRWARRENRMRSAEKFERLLDAYRHPDGRGWSGVELEKATGGS